MKADIHLDTLMHIVLEPIEDDNEPAVSIETSSENEKPYWLLYVSGITGSLALLCRLN